MNAQEIIKFIADAKNRALFAKGALEAVKWLVKQSAGLYNMKDFLNSEE